MSRQDSMTDKQRQNTNSEMNQQEKHRLGTISKRKLLESLNMFDGTNLTLISNVDQDKNMFGSHEISLTSEIYHLLVHTNRDIKIKQRQQ